MVSTMDKRISTVVYQILMNWVITPLLNAVDQWNGIRFALDYRTAHGVLLEADVSAVMQDLMSITPIVMGKLGVDTDHLHVLHQIVV